MTVFLYIKRTGKILALTIIYFGPHNHIKQEENRFLHFKRQKIYTFWRETLKWFLHFKSEWTKALKGYDLPMALIPVLFVLQFILGLMKNFQKLVKKSENAKFCGWGKGSILQLIPKQQVWTVWVHLHTNFFQLTSAIQLTHTVQTPVNPGSTLCLGIHICGG